MARAARAAASSASSDTPEESVAGLRPLREDMTCGGSDSGEDSCTEPPATRQRTHEGNDLQAEINTIRPVCIEVLVESTEDVQSYRVDPECQLHDTLLWRETMDGGLRRLLFNGERVGPRQMLRQLGVKSGDVLQLVDEQKGGGDDDMELEADLQAEQEEAERAEAEMMEQAQQPPIDVDKPEYADGEKTPPAAADPSCCTPPAADPSSGRAPCDERLIALRPLLRLYAKSIDNRALVDTTSNASFGAHLSMTRQTTGYEAGIIGGSILRGLLGGEGSETMRLSIRIATADFVQVTVPKGMVAGGMRDGEMNITRVHPDRVSISIVSTSGLRKYFSSGELPEGVVAKLFAGPLFAPAGPLWAPASSQRCAEQCAVCRTALTTPCQPFENGMPHVICRGGDCEARMRETYEHTVQRALDVPLDASLGAKKKAAEQRTREQDRTRTIATLLTQRSTAAQRQEEARQTTVLFYAPTDTAAHPTGRMPSLLEPIRVRDASTGEFHTVEAKNSLSIERLFMFVFACGAGKSYRIFEAIKDILSVNPSRPVLFVSAKKVHAGDLTANLEDLGFLTYLEEESAAGMGRRISDHVYQQSKKGIGARVVCNVTSVRALPKELLDMFESQHGVIVYDEARTISGYIRQCKPGEAATFPWPDDTLDRLAKMASSSTVILSDADGLCDGATFALAKRVAPMKSVSCICADTHWLDRDLEIAFGNVTDKGAGGDEDKKGGRRSYLHTFFAAVRRARINVKERVYVQCASKSQIEKLKAMLVQRGLWDNERCKMYHGGRGRRPILPPLSLPQHAAAQPAAAAQPLATPPDPQVHLPIRPT
jgi:hypothetical protein